MNKSVGIINGVIGYEDILDFIIREFDENAVLSVYDNVECCYIDFKYNGRDKRFMITHKMDDFELDIIHKGTLILCGMDRASNEVLFKIMDWCDRDSWFMRDEGNGRFERVI